MEQMHELTTVTPRNKNLWKHS